MTNFPAEKWPIYVNFSCTICMTNNREDRVLGQPQFKFDFLNKCPCKVKKKFEFFCLLDYFVLIQKELFDAENVGIAKRSGKKSRHH